MDNVEGSLFAFIYTSVHLNSEYLTNDIEIYRDIDWKRMEEEGRYW